MYGAELVPIQARLLYRKFTLPHIYIYLKYGAGLSSIPIIYLPVIYLQAIYFID